MNTIQKIVASASAAAVIGSGAMAVGLQLDTEGEPETVRQYVDDVHPVTVEIPKVEIPKVLTATVNIPAVETVRIVTSFELDELGIPDVELERVSLPNTQTVDISILNASASNVEMPEVVTPKVISFAAVMRKMIELQKVQMELFRDQRSLQHDSSVGIDSENWPKWIEIYRSPEYRDYIMEYVALPKGLRIINEVKCPENSAQISQLQSNLDYYIKRKYNAVLLTFTTDESLSKMMGTVDFLKSLDLKVIIAYSGIEDLKQPIFKDPEKLAKYLSELGSKSDALLLGWRRTSLHMFLPDKQWTNFLVKNARSKNPKLGIIGMAYFGETADQERGITYDVPENCSAVLVVGLGYPRSSTKTAMTKLFPEIMNHPHKIGLAVGEKPYFDSLHDTNKTKEQNDTIKRRIEIRLIQAGCDSTMTYSGDGSDGHYGRKDRTENLCLSYGR